MKKTVKLLSLALSVILIISSVSICFPVLAATTTGYINGTNVRIRKEATTQSAELAKVDYVTVEVLGSKKGEGNYIWYNVKYGDIVGYVREDLIIINTPTPSTPSTPEADKTFEESLKDFPESYHNALKELHKTYPNWKFVAHKLTMSFETALANEATGFRKVVQYDDNAISWRSMGDTVYNWKTKTWGTVEGGWTGASREVVAYYMDPRNFLDADQIYMFLSQSYDANLQTEDGVKEIIKGTFLEKGYTDPNDTEYGGDYVKVIMEAAKQSSVNPYILAATIRQEQGVNGTSSLISGKYSGYENYYNFFNWNATGSTESAVITNGLAYAKKQGWNTRSKSIILGAVKYGDDYLKRGQDTYFYKDYNLVSEPYYAHQYATAAHDARSKGYGVRNTYKNDTSMALVFKIPVYKSIPDKIAELPAKNKKLNNYYLLDIKATGLTPSFSMYEYNYSLSVDGTTTIGVEVPEKATFVSAKQFDLTKGSNTIKLLVKSETGYLNTYTIKVNSDKIATLNISVNGEPVGDGGNDGDDDSGGQVTPPAPTYILGDTNGDNKITIVDLANVQKHLLSKITLSGTNLLGADTNKDNKITIVDLANIQKHLLGKIKLS